MKPKAALVLFFVMVLMISCTLNDTLSKFTQSSQEKKEEQGRALASTLLFGLDGDIWAFNANQNDLRQITHTPDLWESSPILSPDGASIAYNDPFTGALYIMDADGTNSQELFLGDGNHRPAAWTHDSKSILVTTDFYMTEETEYACHLKIFTIKDDTYKTIYITDKAITGADFSSKDKLIVLSLGQKIYIMNREGEDLTEIAAEEDHWFVHPVFSPNDKQVLFERYFTGDVVGQNMNGSDIYGMYSDLYIVDSDGSDLMRLTDNPTSESKYLWAPSSDSFIFIEYEEEIMSRLMRMNSDGTELQTLLSLEDFPAIQRMQPTVTPTVSVLENHEKTISTPIEAILIEIVKPYGGVLNKDDDFVPSSCADVLVEDFMAEVVFITPEDIDLDEYSFGLFFRDTGKNAEWRINASTRGWKLSNGTTQMFDRKPFAMNTDQGSINRLKLLAVGDTGYLYLNDVLAAELDLSLRLGTGDVCVAVQINSDDRHNIDITFEDFSVWEINQ